MKDLSQTEMATSKKTKSLFAFYWNFLRRVMPHSTPESRYSIIIVTKLLNVFFNKNISEPKLEILEIPTRYRPPDIQTLSQDTG